MLFVLFLLNWNNSEVIVMIYLNVEYVWQLYMQDLYMGAAV